MSREKFKIVLEKIRVPPSHLSFNIYIATFLLACS